MDDQILQNAVDATATPANDAPDVREARRVAVTQELIEGKLDNATRASRMDELRRLTSEPSAVAREDTARTETAAKATAVDREIATLRKNPAFWDGNHPEHEKVMNRMRQLMVASESSDQ